MTYNEFVKKYNGKATDYDGVAGVQCVDLAKLYLDKCFNIKAGAWGNAKDWALNFYNIPQLYKNFDLIEIKFGTLYGKTKVKQGDIFVRTSGTWGHIGIIDSSDSKNLIIYDQNGTGNHDPMTKRVKAYTSHYFTYIIRKKETKDYWKVKANGGLKCYDEIADKKASCVLPDGTKVQMIKKNAGTKTINKVKYEMAKIKHDGDTLYCATKYLVDI